MFLKLGFFGMSLLTLTSPLFRKVLLCLHETDLAHFAQTCKQAREIARPYLAELALWWMQNGKGAMAQLLQQNKILRCKVKKQQGEIKQLKMDPKKAEVYRQETLDFVSAFWRTL